MRLLLSRLKLVAIGNSIAIKCNGTGNILPSNITCDKEIYSQSQMSASISMFHVCSNISEVLLSRSMRDRLLLLVLLVSLHSICFASYFCTDFCIRPPWWWQWTGRSSSPAPSPDSARGAGQCSQECQLTRLQKRSFNNGGDVQSLDFKHILPFFRWTKPPSTSQPRN